MKSKETPPAETAQKKPDLRKGIHGSLIINTVDAGQSSTISDADLKLATPDLSVPAGQTTHE